jgi:hypothetical protein
MVEPSPNIVKSSSITDHRLYFRMRSLFAICATAATLIGLGVQLLNPHPVWAVALMLAGVACILFEANFNPSATKYIPGMFRLLGTVMVVCLLVGVYFHPIMEHFRFSTPSDFFSKGSPTMSSGTVSTEPDGKSGKHQTPSSKRTQSLNSSSTSPRMGDGPEPYKDWTDAQVADSAIKEANRIVNLVGSTIKAIQSHPDSDNMLIGNFRSEFINCCLDEVKEVRTELVRRLGPAEANSEEKNLFQSIYRDSDIPKFARKPELGDVQRYAPHLLALGIKLKTKQIPRPAPISLRFTEQRITPQNGMNIAEMISIYPPTNKVETGFVVVQFDNMVVSLGCDFEGSSIASQNDLDVVENSDLISLFQFPIYPLRIGKSPFSKPIKVLASSNRAFKVLKSYLVAQ